MAGHDKSEALKAFLAVESRRFEAMARHAGKDSAEEDDLLDQLDVIWARLNASERSYVENRGRIRNIGLKVSGNEPAWSNWTRASARLSRIHLSELDPEKAGQFHKSIELRFAKSSRGQRLWERLEVAFSRQDEHGWRRICSAFDDRPVWLFTNVEDDSSVFRFASGAEMARVLEDMPPCEFYATNEGMKYLLCHNHHEFLIAAGEIPHDVNRALCTS